MNKTMWSNIEIKNYKELKQDITTDVLVIGGGICGMLCAYFISRQGYNVVLVEENEIASKKTLKTTAFITALQDVFYFELIEKLGKEKAKLYLNANLEAVEEYKKLSKRFDFDFEDVSSFKYFIDDNDNYCKEMEALRQLGYVPGDIEYNSFPFEFDNAIEFKNQGQMNPLKLINQLKDYFTIYENTKIVKLDNNIAYTDNHKIVANNIVVATGYPFLKLKSLFFMKMHQEKSYVIAIKDNLGYKGNMIGSKKGNLYFRNYKDYLIIGGNDQKTGQNIDSYKPIMNYIKSIDKESDITASWVNQDAMTLDGIPYIGRYGHYDNVFVATGFNMWGMTGSMISAKLITDLINNRENKYEELFSPNRKMIFKPLMSNIGTAIKNLLKLNKRRCNHLGCALFYNSGENVFECPCHGSKYNLEGEVIDGPAINNIKPKM